jgi:hypothetical protein
MFSITIADIFTDQPSNEPQEGQLSNEHQEGLSEDVINTLK